MLLKPEFTNIISEVACSVPVEPRSTSASPLPNTVFPAFCKSASSKPRKVGVDANGPVQRWVPYELGSNSHCNPVIASVPFAETEIAGSLSPSGTSNGVLENLKLPGEVAARAELDEARRNARVSDTEIMFRRICELNCVLGLFVGIINLLNSSEYA